MALIPKATLVGLPVVTQEDLQTADPARLNRILRLLATQINGIQTGAASPSTTITNVTQQITSGASSSGSSSSSAAPVAVLDKVTIQGTHTQRLSTYLAPNQDAGIYYYETDRTVTYLDFVTPSLTQVWQYVDGIMLGLFAAQPVDLTPYDAGFLFYATDRKILYQWSGSVWSEFLTSQPVIEDTYANWTSANYPPANYSPGTLFIITDRNLIYSIQVVTAVNKWVYVSGVYIALVASRPTTGFNGAALGANDTSLMFLATDSVVFEYWTGAAWVVIKPTGASAATYGDGTHVAVIVVDANGRITGISSVAISGVPPSGTAGGDLSGTYPNPTVAQVNGGVVPASAALVGTNSSRQIIAASAFAAASFVPVIQIGGSAASITFTYTATSSKTGTGTGAPVSVVINVTITGWPVLPSGTVTIGGLPETAGATAVGTFAAASGFVGLSAGVSVIPNLSGTTITLDTQGTTGLAALPAATIASGSVFTITLTYQSA